MSLFRRRATPASPSPVDESALDMYLRGSDNSTPGAIALMAEVDRGRARRHADTEQDTDLDLPAHPKPTGNPVTDAINTAMHRAEVDRIRNDAYHQRQHDDAQRSDERRTRLLRACRPATAAEYAAWLEGHLRNGGTISHYYERPADEMWMLTERPVAVPSLFGAQSVRVIVPAGLGMAPEDLPSTFHGHAGHSTFYFMDGFRVHGSWVPLYADVRQMLAR